MKQKIYVISGGTVQHVAPHFAVCAPAYGTVGGDLAGIINNYFYTHLDPNIAEKYEVFYLKTRMTGRHHSIFEEGILEQAGLKHLETNEDIDKLVDFLISKKDTRCIFMASALCDFKPFFGTDIKDKGENIVAFGKSVPRLSSANNKVIEFEPTKKIIDKIRKERKDIFLVTFKTTAGATKEESYTKALSNLKRSSSNLVFVNDIREHHNAVVTPEEFPYWSNSREEALTNLIYMTMKRLELSFDRTVVLDPEMRFMISDWSDKSPTKIPDNFKKIMEYLVERKAFKPFNGKTAGHFGCKILETGFALEHKGKNLPAIRLCSRRKMDHNKIFDKGEGLGIIYGKDETGNILATGGKPSVGEHTQDMIYDKFGDKVHSIVHFHSPLKVEDHPKIPQESQKEFECGSRECGLNTRKGMRELFPGIYAVHLKGHGPNIAFSKEVDHQDIINFIENHWDLDNKTGGILGKS
ncbi:hypothetical protein N9948_01915 [bacterium]|nr:hypothetical protein [bacterium]